MQHLRFYCTRPLSLHHFRLNTTLFWKIFSPLSRAQTTWNCIPSYSIFPACEAGYAVNRRKRKPRIRLPSAAFLSPGRPESSPAAQPVSKQPLPIQRVFPDSYHMAGWSKMDETCRMNECPYRFTLSPFRDCRSSDPLSAVPCLFKNLQSDILHPTGHRNRKKHSRQTRLSAFTIPPDSFPSPAVVSSPGFSCHSRTRDHLRLRKGGPLLDLPPVSESKQESAEEPWPHHPFPCLYPVRQVLRSPPPGLMILRSSILSSPDFSLMSPDGFPGIDLALLRNVQTIPLQTLHSDLRKDLIW